ncbi:hypothetical protein KSF78_0005779 [Schistosoma japonicum]|uniref:SJCHGC02799 protein n=1 Tax=Schistosoma japonicum TaxID=6182 RepID=Q5DHR8_SCHJA|nr:SJCHGC02799 protein [Schistosoma japonicum]KAH8870072.1 hypothetical protein KSF78_0005779 [Schistosoma japonicum]
MYQLNRLIPESINFVHTDTMYKLESFYHPGEKKESFGTKIPTESSCNELNERDKSLLKEIRQLDNSISFLLKLFKSYNSKSDPNNNNAENGSNYDSFVTELHQFSYHISNLINHYKTNPVESIHHDNIYKELSVVDLELEEILNMFKGYSHQNAIGTTTTTVTHLDSPSVVTKEPVTLIIQCNPNNPPLSVLLFCHLLLNDQQKITICSFLHSTVNELPLSLKKLIEILLVDLNGSSDNADKHQWKQDTKLCLHFIWNSSCPDCSVSSLDKSITPTQLYGECMLIQLIVKTLEPYNFEQLSSLIITIDSCLLLPRLSLLNAQNVEHKSLNTLNNHPYFTKLDRELPSIVDCFLFICIKTLNLSGSLPANLKVWSHFCSKWKSFKLLSL